MEIISLISAVLLVCFFELPQMLDKRLWGELVLFIILVGVGVVLALYLIL